MQEPSFSNCVVVFYKKILVRPLTRSSHVLVSLLRILDSCGPGAPLFSLGKGKYYREDGELTLDVGPFAAALEFATGKEAQVC